MHANLYENYKSSKQTEKHGKNTEEKQKQLTIESAFRMKAKLTQKRFDDLILKFIVRGMHPLQTVEDEDFQNLLNGKL